MELLLSETAAGLGKDASKFTSGFAKIISLLKNVNMSTQTPDDDDETQSQGTRQEHTRHRALLADVMRESMPMMVAATMLAVMHNDDKSDMINEIKADVINEVKTVIIPEAIEAAKSQITTDVIEQTREETTTIVTNVIANSNKKTSSDITKRLIKSATDIDRWDACDRKLNLTFAGIKEEPGEHRNSEIIANAIINKLNDKGCQIQIEDIEKCYRIIRKGPGSSAANADNPGLIFVRFTSHRVRNKVLNSRQNFNDPTNNIFMNEDMTPMQRKLFNYLRNKEDIILKKSVGYKDGKIVFLLVANHHHHRWPDG